MISPTIIAVIANISTAPADMSFASFAFGCLSGIARSTVVSMAVFINSNDITNPNSITHAIHSNALILHMIPAIITTIIIAK